MAHLPQWPCTAPPPPPPKICASKHNPKPLAIVSSHSSLKSIHVSSFLISCFCLPSMQCNAYINNVSGADDREATDVKRSRETAHCGISRTSSQISKQRLGNRKYNVAFAPKASSPRLLSINQKKSFCKKTDAKAQAKQPKKDESYLNFTASTSSA